MNQIKVTARHDDTINRVIQGNHIQPGKMIEYLQSRLDYIMCSGSDLNHEVAMGLAEKAEPGFYEKLFAELNAEMEMVKAIIEKLKEAEEQTYLEGVIQFLELVQKVTTYNAATFLREFESPSPAYDSEASRSHTKMLLDEAQHEIECLDVVIAMLKEELEWENCEVYVAKPQEEKDRILKERQAEGSDIDDMLAAIRKRREEAREAMKGGV